MVNKLLFVSPDSDCGIMPVQSEADKYHPGLSKRLAWPEGPGARFRAIGGLRLLAGLGLGLLTFGGVEGLLAGASDFRAHAIAGISDAARGSGALEQAAVLAMTKPVLARAAIVLRDKGFSMPAPKAPAARGRRTVSRGIWLPIFPWCQNRP
jgi:hypothetical protein